ncbi:MAG: Fe-Mn family superoxide dismutase [Halopseudomonas aestusnigri]
MGTLQTFPTYNPGDHYVRDIPFKAHKIVGISPELLEGLYENIYGGAIRCLNDVETMIAAYSKDTPWSTNIERLKSQELQLVNEIILHEIYFDSIGEDGGEVLDDQTLESALLASFGSITKWQTIFTAMALATQNGSTQSKFVGNGWVVLAWSNRQRRLINIASNKASETLVDAHPILVLNINEDAYALDYGSDRKSYVDAFMNNIQWGCVAHRFTQTINHQAINKRQKEKSPDVADGHISVKELKGLVDCGDDSYTVIDVRHDDDRKRYRFRIMETDFRDSFNVKSWTSEIPRGKLVVVYCMYGFWVSQKVAEELRAQGVNALSLSGGVTAWRAMGFLTTENEF